MSTNNQSNRLIKWIVMLGDFVLLNLVILIPARWSWQVNHWPARSLEIFILVNNIALILSQMKFSTVIHMRVISAGDVVQRLLGLTMMETVLAYVLLKVFDYNLPIGWIQLAVGATFLGGLLLKRMAERWFIKLYRQAGRNSRTVTLVGNDPELLTVYDKLATDDTMGYRVLGYYADTEIGEWTHSLMPDGRRKTEDGSQFTVQNEGLTDDENSAISHQPSNLKYLGTLQEFLRLMQEDPEQLALGDEMYVSLSRRDRDVIKRISRFCDHKVIRFYYVPVSVESIGLNLKREMLEDIEIFTTYENPLENPVK